MSSSTSEARELLERALNLLGKPDHVEEAEQLYTDIDTFLAQPEPAQTAAREHDAEKALTVEQIEERRRNLKAFREELEMEGDQTFNTTLLMQEGWLATVDSLAAREAVLVAQGEEMRDVLQRLRDAVSRYGLMITAGKRKVKDPEASVEIFAALKEADAALADTSPATPDGRTRAAALLAQGKVLLDVGDLAALGEEK